MKIHFKFIAVYLLAVSTLIADAPRNVILMIGDGMGLAQVSTAVLFRDVTSAFERFKTIGLIKTQSASHKITDSGAGGTAFSIGRKSYNGAISMDANGNPQKLISTYFDEMGKSIGVISTSAITHATPACFFSHSKSRKDQDGIAMQLHNSPVDFFAGGGQKYFTGRSDGAKLYDSLKAAGFVLETSSLANVLNPDGKNKYGFLLAEDGMPKMSEGRGAFLPDATALALRHLSQDNGGFFLMVEGSQIDWGGHDNDADYILREMLDFEAAIAEAFDFAEQEGNTLLIVTADHETGGMALTAKDDDYAEVEPAFTTGGHSATMIPVFTFGPGAESFSGIYENTELFNKMLKAVGK